MDFENYFREDFDRIQEYRPGEQPSEEGWVKLNTNENPYPPPQVILDDIKAAVDNRLRLYPDPSAKYLRQMISSVLLVEKNTLTNPKSIFVDNGSDGILENAFKAFTDPEDEVVYFNPSYGMYRILAMCYRVKRVEIKLTDDFSIPPEAFSTKGKLMFVNSPNNPNGKAFSKNTIAKLCENFPGIVIVDEAYGDFCDVSALPLLKEVKNLIVVRTFSKSFSLASMRVGFAVADPEIIKALNKVKLPYNVNYLTQAAAVSCIKHRNLIFEQNKKIISERERLTEAISKYNGVSVEPSDANFIFIKFSEKSVCLKFNWDLREKDILVRHFSQPGLYQFLRVSIGTPEDNSKFLEGFDEISKKYL